MTHISSELYDNFDMGDCVGCPVINITQPTPRPSICVDHIPISINETLHEEPESEQEEIEHFPPPPVEFLREEPVGSDLSSKQTDSGIETIDPGFVYLNYF